MLHPRTPAISKPNYRRKIKILQKITKHADLPEISIPGINNLYKPVNKTRKFIWFSALSFCVFIALFQIENRIEYFINGSVAVRVSVDQNEKLNLPFITICPPMDHNHSIIFSNLTKIYKQTFNKTTTSIFDLLQLPELRVQQLWDMTKLHRVGFLVQSLNLTITNNFTFNYWPSIYGTCVTLHKKENFATYLLPEILLELTNTGWNYPNFLVFNSFILSTAYKIILHDKPLTLYDVAVFGHRCFAYNGLILHYNVIKYSFVNTRKSPCTDDSKIFHECRVQCLNNILKQHISCRLPYHLINNMPLCLDRETSIKSNQTTYKILAQFKWNQCPCHRLCSGLSFSSSHNAKWMVSRKISFVRIFFHFHDATIDNISEYVNYTLVDLLCDVGSILGLMLGICILTFIQIIEVGFYFIRNKITGENKVTAIKRKRIIKVSAISF